jgi:phospholipid transport system substrate-binding protein
MRRIKIPGLLCVGLLLVSFSGAFAAESPKEAIQTTVDTIISTLKEGGQSARKKEKRAKIQTLVRSRFDFDEMAKRTLARHWEKRTPAEKKEFTSIFSDLLVYSYLGKVEGYTDEKITYEKGKSDDGDDYATVDTLIITKNVNIPIQYKVMLKNSRWWVYDVVIEGVSMVSTYRTQYNKIILGESYEELIKKMKSKLVEVKSLLDSDKKTKK